jgi:predicted extracellular nuclease
MLSAILIVGLLFSPAVAQTPPQGLEPEGTIISNGVYNYNSDPAVIITNEDDAANAVRISQVYGGGGNSGATYKNDFIELFNASDVDVDLTGWSVQYASVTGNSWSNKTNLSGTIPANSYYLIQQAAGDGGTVDLPTPDATGNIAMQG